MDKALCPVCEKHFFARSGDYDICPVCKWENDPVQFYDHNYAGGANVLCVNDFRKEYIKSLKNCPSTNTSK